MLTLNMVGFKLRTIYNMKMIVGNNKNYDS